MPFKANADRRHHIPKQQDRVTNWPEYDAALRQPDGVVQRRSDRGQAGRATHDTGGQPRYSAVAIAGQGEGGLACNQVLYHMQERAIGHAVLPWCERP